MWLQKVLDKEKHDGRNDDKYTFLTLQLGNDKEQLKAL